MIKCADDDEIPIIEEILGNAVIWMNEKGIPNLWNEKNTKWESLVKNYDISDFCIYYEHQKPLACMAITDMDHTYWPDIPKGEALYLHKLAVKAEARGNGISKEMIDYVKTRAVVQGISSIHLDCNASRQKLCQLYEKQGFRYVKKVDINPNYSLALYTYQL